MADPRYVHQRQRLQCSPATAPSAPLSPHTPQPKAVVRGLKTPLGTTTLYPPIQGWDLRFGFKEPALLQLGPPPLGRLAWSCRARRSSRRGQLRQHQAVSKSDGRPRGTPTASLSSSLRPWGALLAPFCSLVWVLWARTACGAQHRGVSPSLEPTGTTPTQTPRGDESTQSTGLIHNAAASQTRRQKGLSLSTLNEALNDDPVAR